MRLVVEGLYDRARGVVLKTLLLLGVRLVLMDEVGGKLKSYLLFSVLPPFPLVVPTVYVEGHKPPSLWP